VFEGRRVDLIGRSIPASPNLDPVDIAIEYLTTRRTASARFLAAKPVIVLEPARLLGHVVWPESDPYQA